MQGLSKAKKHENKNCFWFLNLHIVHKQGGEKCANKILLTVIYIKDMEKI